MGSRLGYASVVLSLSIIFVWSAEARTPAGRGAVVADWGLKIAGTAV